MSNEQSQIPQHDQPNWYGQASFIPGEQVDFRKSNLESIQQIRSAAFAAAMYAIPSGSLEVVNPTVEQQRLTPPQEAKLWSENVANIRMAYQNDNFDLSQDEVVTQDMFGKAA